MKLTLALSQSLRGGGWKMEGRSCDFVGYVMLRPINKILRSILEFLGILVSSQNFYDHLIRPMCKIYFL